MNEWDEFAEDWDTNSAVEEYAENAYEQLLVNCDINNKTILDFGCGTGSLTKRLVNQAQLIVAIDPAQKMIEQLDKKTLPNVVTVSEYLNEKLINTHPAFKNKFDIIVASSVCGFLPNYEATIILLKSLLSPEGVFIQWDWLAQEHTDSSASKTNLSKTLVTDVFQRCKFNDITITTPFSMESSTGNTLVLMAIGKNSKKT